MADQVKITVTENGPLSVKGPLTLVDQDGNQYDLGARKHIRRRAVPASEETAIWTGAVEARRRALPVPDALAHALRSRSSSRDLASGPPR